MGQFDESAIVLDLFGNQTTGILVDVGAHFGSTLKPYLNRNWRVIAVEPDSSKWNRLEALGQGKSFSLHRVAVARHDHESASFYTSPESTGIASLIPFHPSHQRTASVRVRSMRSILRDEAVDQIDFLKIDTEGMDFDVVSGFPFESIRPNVILTEFDELKTSGLGHHYQSLGDLLCSKGYVVFLSEWFPIVRYGATHQWRSIKPYPCALNNPQAWGNFIAVRNDLTDKIARLASQVASLALAA